MGQAPSAVGGVRSVILVHPVGPMPTTGFRLDEPLIDQFGLDFSPHRIVVGLDAPVVFRNSESSLSHNITVRALADGETLLNDDASAGDELPVTIPHVGGYEVSCDMHPGMAAFIFATDAPIATFADDDGSFHFEDLEPGRYSIQLWTRAGGMEEPVEVEVDSTTTRIELGTTG